MIHEFLGRKVDDLTVAGMLADVPSHRVHQMGLAETDPAVKVERVERNRLNGVGAGLSDMSSGGMSELVGLADDEILEQQALIER